MSQHAEIDRVFAAWSAAVVAKDVEALVGLVTPDGELWTHGAPALCGLEAVRSTFEGFFARYDLRQDFELLELIVREDVAIARGIEHNRLVPAGGGDPVERTQRAMSILFRLPDGQWRFARGMTNLPPAAP